MCVGRRLLFRNCSIFRLGRSAPNGLLSGTALRKWLCYPAILLSSRLLLDRACLTIRHHWVSDVLARPDSYWIRLRSLPDVGGNRARRR